VPRRVSMPAADDLFRPTAEQPTPPAVPAEPVAEHAAGTDATEPEGPQRPSGRVRHDEKMTVYVTSAELLAIEQARLRLRSEHGLAIDRGRLVREALGLVLGDFEERGETSDLVARLTVAQE
jgi:hypothetical protein